MTTPQEEWDSLTQAEELLYALTYPHLTPRVPLKIRKRAARILRHYPLTVRRAMMRQIVVEYESRGRYETIA